MSAVSKPRSSEDSMLSLIARITIILIIDGIALWLIWGFLQDGVIVLPIALGLVALMSTVIIWRSQFYPLRWMLIGLVLLSLFSIYPNLFTVYVAFTNFGDGHLLTKEQAITQITRERYLPEGGSAFTWTAFVDDSESFLLWLQDESGEGFLAVPNDSGLDPTAVEPGPLDADGIPESVPGYERLNRLQVVRFINPLGGISFETERGGTIVQIRSLDDAAELERKYVYDEAADAMINQETGTVYEVVDGTFTSDRGEELRPGFQSVVGLENFRRFFDSPALRGPLVRIILWNFAFAFLSVFMTFALGLGIAYIYNDRSLPGRKIIQSFLLIPYTIPSLITILIWRGMLNPDVGVINKMIDALLGTSPPWFTDPLWAKAGILLVNLWLGYPYFMLICSGALQAIPEDIYSAAEVDGANAWQRFRQITLPLLLVAVGPLLVASFTFNFNNFNLIFLFIQGGPPIAGAATRAGHTDILISYVYNLAFAGGRGFDYGLASAVTIIIFVVVAALTLFQFRYTQMWEEVGEGV